MTSASEMLERGRGILVARGAEYDREGGERSAAAAAGAFNAITGRVGERALTEYEAWVFLVCLKMVRLSSANGPHDDSATDAGVYAALAGESKYRPQAAAGKATPQPIEPPNPSERQNDALRTGVSGKSEQSDAFHVEQTEPPVPPWVSSDFIRAAESGGKTWQGADRKPYTYRDGQVVRVVPPGKGPWGEGPQVSPDASSGHYTWIGPDGRNWHWKFWMPHPEHFKGLTLDAFTHTAKESDQTPRQTTTPPAGTPAKGPVWAGRMVNNLIGPDPWGRVPAAGDPDAYHGKDFREWMGPDGRWWRSEAGVQWPRWWSAHAGKWLPYPHASDPETKRLGDGRPSPPWGIIPDHELDLIAGREWKFSEWIGPDERRWRIQRGWTDPRFWHDGDWKSAVYVGIRPTATHATTSDLMTDLANRAIGIGKLIAGEPVGMRDAMLVRVLKALYDEAPELWAADIVADTVRRQMTLAAQAMKAKESPDGKTPQPAVRRSGSSQSGAGAGTE